MGWVKTGVFATTAEKEMALKLAEAAAYAPVMHVRGTAPEPVTLSDLASGKLRTAVHSMALSHNLPEIRGYYGMLQSGEFVMDEMSEGKEPDAWPGVE